jgi:hypothetical protein
MPQWVRVNAELPRHRKTERLMRAGSLTRLQAVGALVVLWTAIRTTDPDGNLEGWTVADLEAVVGHEGIGRAMVETGWVEETSLGLQVHDWTEHNGEFLKDAERMRGVRERKRIAAGRSRTVPEQSPTVQASRTRADGTGRDGRGASTETPECSEDLRQEGGVGGTQTDLLAPDGSSVRTVSRTSPKIDTPKADEWIPAFDQWYETYPRKVKRPDALRAWKAIKPHTQETFDEIDSGTDAWIGYWKRTDTPKEKIPYPASFLNGRQWRDEP